MKRNVILLAAFFMCFSANAVMAATNWIETNDGKVECRDINLGLTKARVTLEDGKTVDYYLNEINSFSQNGKLYNKNRGEFVRIVLQNQTPGVDHDLAVASLGVSVTPVAAGQRAAPSPSK